jgi:nucleoside-triphosphatase THEP1
MKILILNIRGIGKPARVRQLREMILREQVEVGGIQEPSSRVLAEQTC